MQVKYRWQGSDKVVGVGLLEVRIIGVKPLHCQLQGAPGVEAAGTWSAVDVLLVFAGGYSMKNDECFLADWKQRASVVPTPKYTASSF